MTRRDLIYNTLLELTNNEGIDAQTLSLRLNISRGKYQP